MVNYRRPVRVALADGAFLDPAVKPADPAQAPGRPFVGALGRRGEAMKGYVPSLAPVRIAGKYPSPASE